jgi:hypothetical protein
MASHTRLVMNTTIRTYLRSLTQIENVGTKREQFVAIYSHYERYLSYFALFNELLGHFADYRFPAERILLSILKIARMTISNEKG